jgi:hypothetical protein
MSTKLFDLWLVSWKGQANNTLVGSERWGGCCWLLGPRRGGAGVSGSSRCRQEGALDGLDVVQPPAEVLVVELAGMRFKRAPVNRVRPLLVPEEVRSRRKISLADSRVTTNNPG